MQLHFQIPFVLQGCIPIPIYAHQNNSWDLHPAHQTALYHQIHFLYHYRYSISLDYDYQLAPSNAVSPVAIVGTITTGTITGTITGNGAITCAGIGAGVGSCTDYGGYSIYLRLFPNSSIWDPSSSHTHFHFYSGIYSIMRPNFYLPLSSSHLLASLPDHTTYSHDN